MKSSILGIILVLLVPFSQAACPKKVAAGAYSGVAETVDYTSNNASSTWLVQEHVVGLITITLDGKGTATTAGKATLAGYLKKMSQSSTELISPENWSYKFYPQSCQLYLEPPSDSPDNNPVYVLVTDSGAELVFITNFLSNSTGLVDKGRLRKH